MNFWEKRDKFLEDNKGKKDVEVRCTYRSMSCCLDTIAQAMKNPNEPQKIYDHLPYESAFRNNIKMTERLVKEMNLKGFILNKTTGQLMFVLDKKLIDTMSFDKINS